MPESLDRRAFLQYAAAVSAVSLAGLRPPTPAVANGGAGNRVVVLGAGLAGLGAAYNLIRHGYEVIVLEAQDRPGGRVLTVRDGFQRGGYAEMGAVRIFETHTHTQKYIAEFGLSLTPYDTGDRVFYMQRRRFMPPPAGVPWPLRGFAPGEQPDPGAKIPQYLLSGFDKIGDVNDAGWPGAFPSAVELDRTTITGYLQSQGASDTWVDWLYAQEGGIGRTNAAAGFGVESVAGGSELRSIAGGNDRLPYAFARALGGRVKYGSEVVRVAQDRRGVTVGYTERGRRHELRADRVVCALPFAPLRRVSLSGFSDRKRTAIDRLRYMAAGRCYFQTRTRFWQQDPLAPLGGVNLVGTDTMAGRVWNTSSQQPDPTLGMVHAYMFDTEALEFASLGRRRVDAMEKLFHRLLPGIRGQVIGVAEKLWQEDPWAGGGWGWVQPGELSFMFPAMREPDGRVHFAGEHTSIWIAYMNGALESAERAVGEVLRRRTGGRRLAVRRVAGRSAALVACAAERLLRAERRRRGLPAQSDLRHLAAPSGRCSASSSDRGAGSSPRPRRREPRTIAVKAIGTETTAGWASSVCSVPVPSAVSRPAVIRPVAEPAPRISPSAAPRAVRPGHQMPSSSSGQKVEAASAKAQPTRTEMSVSRADRATSAASATPTAAVPRKRRRWAAALTSACGRRRRQTS